MNCCCYCCPQDTPAEPVFVVTHPVVYEKSTPEPIREEFPAKSEEPIALLTEKDKNANNDNEFVLELRKGPNDVIGLDVDWADMQKLRITKVKDGLISKWNANNPAKAILIGDCIVEINGSRGDSKALLDAVKEANGTIKMNIIRA